MKTDKQFHTKTWGKQRVKYTTHNEGNENQVCVKTRQNKWKMKNGSDTARTSRGIDFSRSHDTQAFGIDGMPLISELKHSKIMPSTALDMH